MAGHETVGQWSLDQICNHLATAVRLTVEVPRPRRTARLGGGSPSVLPVGPVPRWRRASSRPLIPSLLPETPGPRLTPSARL